MLAAIRKAEKSITFETFAMATAPKNLNDQPLSIADHFFRAMAARARAGVQVKVILDAIGCRKVQKEDIAMLRKAGAEVVIFHPPNPFRPWRWNNRTHRKILVVDGQIAYTGGAGFGYTWNGDAHTKKHWRDNQYEITGPAVADFQRSFCENWKENTGEELQGFSYFPPLRATGPTRMQVVWDSPADRRHPIAHSVLATINGARESLFIQQAYFVPNTDFRKALLAAAARGVKITVMVPNETIDSKPTRHASQIHWKRYLAAGIQLYQYEKARLHTKVIVADARLSIVGSANLDGRSFFINDENNLHVDSRVFAREQLRIIRKDLLHSTRITPANLSSLKPPFYQTIFARLLEEQL